MSGVMGERTHWTDEQCLQFAAVAFRHAPKNLPTGVTLEDIRMAASTVYGLTAPPRPEASAPVGVEDWRRLGGAQRFLDWNRKQAEPPVRIGWEHQVFEAALDQQPAAVDEAMVERGAKAGWGSIPVGCQWQELDPPTRSNWRRIARAVLTAALAGQQQGGQP